MVKAVYESSGPGGGRWFGIREEMESGKPRK